MGLIALSTAFAERFGQEDMFAQRLPTMCMSTFMRPSAVSEDVRHVVYEELSSSRMVRAFRIEDADSDACMFPVETSLRVLRIFAKEVCRIAAEKPRKDDESTPSLYSLFVHHIALFVFEANCRTRDADELLCDLISCSSALGAYVDVCAYDREAARREGYSLASVSHHRGSPFKLRAGDAAIVKRVVSAREDVARRILADGVELL